MTDDFISEPGYTTLESAYVSNPMLRICARYPATDGSCPEEIEIEVRESAVDRSFIPDMIAALATVPGWARGQAMTTKKAREGC